MADYFDADFSQHDLRGKTMRGGVVTIAAQAINTVIHLAAIPVLSRLLAPEDFGLIMMVTVFTGFASLFVDAGLSMATVQRQNITHQQVSNLFWIATGLGLLIAVVVSVCSPLIAAFYGKPRLTVITLALAVPYVFSGMTVQSLALLQRAMRFNRLAFVTVFSQSLGLAAAIVWAVRFQDTEQAIWALVLLPVVNSFVQMLATWILCGWWPSFPRRLVGTRKLVVFGANLTGSSMLTYLVRNVDYLLIGWQWGDTMLGFYERAYKLLLFPIQKINQPISAVMIPALSRLQNEPNRFRRAYWKALRSLCALGMPIVAFMTLDANRLVPLVLGDQYLDCVPIYWALAPAAFLGTFNVASGWAFIALDRTHVLLRWQLISVPITMAAFLIGLLWGPIGVAIAFSTVRLVLRPIELKICYDSTPLSLTQAFHALGPVALRAIGSAVLAGLVRLRYDEFFDQTIFSILVLGLIYAVVYGVAWLVPAAFTARKTRSSDQSPE